MKSAGKGKGNHSYLKAVRMDDVFLKGKKLSLILAVFYLKVDSY